MAERLKSVCHIARLLTGADPRRHNETVSAVPDGVSAHAWADAQPAAERIFVGVVDGIDWQRVLIEAHIRHEALGHGGVFHGSADIGFSTFQEVCGPCLNEALLGLDTQPSWNDEEESPRCIIYKQPGLDQPLVTPPGFGGPADDWP